MFLKSHLSVQGGEPCDGLGQTRVSTSWQANEPLEQQHSCVQNTVNGVCALLLGPFHADVITHFEWIKVLPQVWLLHSLEPVAMPKEQGDVGGVMLEGGGG